MTATLTNLKGDILERTTLTPRLQEELLFRFAKIFYFFEKQYISKMNKEHE